MTTENLFHRITYVYLFMLLLSVPLAGAQPGKQPPANPYGVNPTVALIIVVIISALFFFAFFLLYFWQCYDDNTRSVHRTVVGGGWLRMETNGLDPAVIETFPTFLYSAVKDLKLGKGALECAVCLKEFEDDEILQLLPKCDHVFHLECINPWLVSHITCPVCRANLMPDEVSITVTDSERGGDEESRRFEIVEDQNKELPGPDVLNPSQTPVQNRPTRSGSTRPRLAGKFPRSHSTGHSLVQPGENCERFTLRLPEDVRKQIVSGKLNRTRSCVAFSGEGSGSTRRGYRIGGEGSSRGKSYQFVRLDRESKSERWMFSMAPNFFTRTFSGRSPRMAAKGESTTTPGHSFK